MRNELEQRLENFTNDRHYLLPERLSNKALLLYDAAVSHDSAQVQKARTALKEAMYAEMRRRYEREVEKIYYPKLAALYDELGIKPDNSSEAEIEKTEKLYANSINAIVAESYAEVSRSEINLTEDYNAIQKLIAEHLPKPETQVTKTSIAEQGEKRQAKK